MRPYRTISASALLLTGLLVGQARSDVIEQWVEGTVSVSSITFSGMANVERESLWGAPNGSCETYEEYDPFTDSTVVADYGDNAWISGARDLGPEGFEVAFAIPVHAQAIEVYETFGPGAIVSVKVRDPSRALIEVWSGQSEAVACPSVLRIDFEPLDFATTRILVEMNTMLVPGWNQIDAVKLIGEPAVFEPLFGRIELQTSRLFEPRASIDLDNDGWPEMIDRSGNEGAEFFPPLLMHNEGQARFVERSVIFDYDVPWVTPGGGPISADYDNDGDIDIFHPAIVQNTLTRNDRGRRFVNATVEAGLTLGNSGSGAVWLDYDNDGFLDVFVTQWAPAFIPGADGLYNRLFRNQGDGTFLETTDQAGVRLVWHTPDDPQVGGSIGGALAADWNDDGWNDDGWTDLYVPVANSRNRLLINEQGRFRDATTTETGIAASPFGGAAGDIDNDGDLDLIVGSPSPINQSADVSAPEAAALLLNLGDASFVNVTATSGLGVLIGQDTFGGRFFDVDNDGDVDLLFGGGTPSYFENDGTGQFTEHLFASGVTKALALADFDGDGFLDIGDDTAIGRGNDNHWLAIDLVGTDSNRDGLGARVYAATGDRRQTRELNTNDGFMQDHLKIHFGLGEATVVDELEIRWPSGQVDRIAAVPADREIRVVEGRGEWYPAPRAQWVEAPPAELTYATETTIAAAVRPPMFEPTATIAGITADLSSIGGSPAVALDDLGDGTYRLPAQTFTVTGDGELPDIEISIEQQTSLGPYWVNMSRNVTVDGVPMTAVLETQTDAAPDDFGLHQNYPNPFNSGTVIAFSLPTDSEVELTVYNLAGQRVATLASGFRAAGRYRLHWDGRDASGRSLASGMYLYRLVSAGLVETRRLMLLQ